MPTDVNVPTELLSRLIGARMYSVEFVLNDYVQLRFDGVPGTGDHATLNCYVWPLIQVGDCMWKEPDVGYADALRRLTPGTVTSATEGTGTGIVIRLETGAVVIHPRIDEVYVEIAALKGFEDGAWMVWRPGEDSFADLRWPEA